MIRNPDNTKKRSTPDHPSDVTGTRQMWNAMTRMMGEAPHAIERRQVTCRVVRGIGVRVGTLACRCGPRGAPGALWSTNGLSSL